jgi:hypothetical protein
MHPLPRSLHLNEKCAGFIGGSVARAEIDAGVCGFTTTVRAVKNGSRVTLEIESECEAIRELAAELREVDPFREFTFRGQGPQALQMGARYCSHPACPVPVGIIKAVEVEAGLALPADATIRLSSSDD